MLTIVCCLRLLAPLKHIWLPHFNPILACLGHLIRSDRLESFRELSALTAQAYQRGRLEY